MITSDGPVLKIELPSTPVRRPGSAPLSLRALEREHVVAVLQADRMAYPWAARRRRHPGTAADDAREPNEVDWESPARQETPIMVETPIYGRTLVVSGIRRRSAVSYIKSL